MDDAQLIDSPRERSALTFVQFADNTSEWIAERYVVYGAGHASCRQKVSPVYPNGFRQSDQ